jgi:hypothetical protein
LLARNQACWQCCDRPCRVCANATGSAFIDICWPCWFKTEYGTAPVARKRLRPSLARSRSGAATAP